MKFLVNSLLILFSTTSHGQVLAYSNDKCELKSKNAASYQLAQEIAVPVQQVQVLMYAGGSWTKAMEDNVGFNIVEVKAKDIAKRYQVIGQQIGRSTDCAITQVNEDIPAWVQ
jgi:hypothetical protein